jgi:hypothetical protein
MDLPTELATLQPWSGRRARPDAILRLTPSFFRTGHVWAFARCVSTRRDGRLNFEGSCQSVPLHTTRAGRPAARSAISVSNELGPSAPGIPEQMLYLREAGDHVPEFSTAAHQVVLKTAGPTRNPDASGTRLANRVDLAEYASGGRWQPVGPLDSTAFRRRDISGPGQGRVLRGIGRSRKGEGPDARQ